MDNELTTFGELATGEYFDRPYPQSRKGGYRKLNAHEYAAVGWHHRHQFVPSVKVFRLHTDAEGNVIPRTQPEPYEHVPAEQWGKVTLPLEWDLHGKRVVWQGAKLTIKQITRRRGTAAYDVWLDAGEWCDDRALMMLCDGNTPTTEGHPGHFGGKIARDGDTAQVVIYTD